MKFFTHLDFPCDLNKSHDSNDFLRNLNIKLNDKYLAGDIFSNIEIENRIDLIFTIKITFEYIYLKKLNILDDEIYKIANFIDELKEQVILYFNLTKQLSGTFDNVKANIYDNIDDTNSKNILLDETFNTQPNNILHNTESTSYTKSELDINWMILRRRAFEEYGKNCFECGSINNLDVHHILPREDGGLDELENLIILCRDCHERFHGFKINPDKNTRELRKYNNKAVLLKNACDHQLIVSFEYIDHYGEHSIRKAKASKIILMKSSEIPFVRSVISTERLFEMEKQMPKLYFCAYQNEVFKRFRVSRMSNITSN